MTLLPEKHPRKPGWSHYRCNECGEAFWGPSPGGLPSKVHSCVGCLSAPRSIHSTSGSNRGTLMSDVNYHGGEFNRGEW